MSLPEVHTRSSRSAEARLDWLCDDGFALIGSRNRVIFKRTNFYPFEAVDSIKGQGDVWRAVKAAFADQLGYAYLGLR